MKKILFIILVCLYATQIFSQIDHTKAGETLLLNATIKNDIGEPVNVEVRFVDLNNKPVIARSNDEGTLQAVLKQGTTYYAVFKNYIEVGGIHPFQTPKAGKYIEDSKMFLIRKIQENTEFQNLWLFKHADSNLTDEGIAFLAYFKEFYALNKNLQFKMVISANEMNFRDLSQSRTEMVNNKKKTIKFKVTAQEQLQQFLESRTNTLTAKLKELNIPAKVFSFEYNTKISNTKHPKNKKSLNQQNEPNALVIIEKILKL